MYLQAPPCVAECYLCWVHTSYLYSCSLCHQEQVYATRYIVQIVKEKNAVYMLNFWSQNIFAPHPNPYDMKTQMKSSANKFSKQKKVNYKNC